MTEPLFVRSKVAKQYFDFLRQTKYVIVVFWALVLGFGTWIAPKFLQECSMDFNPPDGSASVVAQHEFDRYFENDAGVTSIALLISPKDENSPLITDSLSPVKDFSLELAKRVNNYNGQHNTDLVQNVGGYWLLFMEGNTLVAASFNSEDNRYSIINISIYTGNAMEDDFLDFLQSAVTDLTPANAEFTYRLTGSPYLLRDVKTGTARDMSRMDMIVAPIAMLVLAIILQSFRMMIIPLLTIATSFVCSFMIMYPVALNRTVVAFCPSVMMSALMAMSIDYSLFLLTRYREEILGGRSNDQSVVSMVESAGHTILVSGTALSLCFLGLVLFPLDLLSSVGLGAAIAVMITLMVNMTLAPAILLIFPKFFTTFLEPATWPATVRSWFGGPPVESQRRKDSGAERLLVEQERVWLDTDPIDMADTERQTSLDEDDREMMNSSWYKLGLLAIKYPLPVLAVVVAITIPFSLYSFTFKETADMNLAVPRDSEAVKTSKALSEVFPVGLIMPYKLLVVPHNSTVLDESFFGRTRTTIMDLLHHTDLQPGDVQSIMYSKVQPEIPVWMVEDARNYTGDLPQLLALKYMYYGLVTQPEPTATYIGITLGFEPTSSQGQTWLDAARDIIAKAEERTGDKYFLAAGAGPTLDAIDKVYSLFPLMIGVTLGVVFILVAVMFQSVFAPLRSVVTISITLMIVFGFASLTYEYGVLEFMGADQLSKVGALNWITPVMSFSVLCGLALDYDVFLMARVVEFRDLGYSDNSAVVAGITKTGSIITAAGIIMAIAFSGLFLSSEMVLNQFAFFLVVSVLLDTFIVRTILVPALMSLAGKWNWWPRKIPEGSKVLIGCE
eukprot:GFYU01000222.1.p1 GENE.GFYU01000222.1~~GFYU01000222.1.p1  ORF type:complete len:843 (+),score=247.73 GFYU01000222.1:254-2782(+)